MLDVLVDHDVPLALGDLYHILSSGVQCRTLYITSTPRVYSVELRSYPQVYSVKLFIYHTLYSGVQCKALYISYPLLRCIV